MRRQAAVRISSRRGATPLRDMLAAAHDHTMARWPRRVDPFGEALRAGRDVVVGSGHLVLALRHAGRPPGRFADDAPDGCRAWLIGGDDSLTLIEDHHVEHMAQADFDELLAGRGARGVGAVGDPAAAVSRYTAWTIAIRGAMG